MKTKVPNKVSECTANLIFEPAVVFLNQLGSLATYRERLCFHRSGKHGQNDNKNNDDDETYIAVNPVSSKRFQLKQTTKKQIPT